MTINSDDVLMFDSDVSKEYQRLYDHGTLRAEELMRSAFAPCSRWADWCPYFYVTGTQIFLKRLR